jgi:glutathione S-transferase
MKLHLTPNSTYSRRVRIAVLEKGLDVEIVETDKAARQQPAYRALNPYGRIPAIVDGDFVLYESTAILRYLEERWPEPALVPADAEGRGLVEMHVKLCDIEFSPYAIRMQRPKRFEPEAKWDRADIARGREGVVRHFEVLERELAGKDYLVGGRFTLADLVYVPFLHFHSMLEVELPPAIAAWWGRLAERESVRATEPTA